MSYYPILLDLSGKTALVAGGGNVARRKIESLLDHGAEVRVVSRELTGRVKELVDSGRVSHLGEYYTEACLEGAFVVIAATDDEDLNREISLDARKRGLLVNAVDQPHDCNFILPSVLRRGDLVVAVSTSGKSPAAAKKIREDLERQFGEEYATFLTVMGRVREAVRSMGLPQEENGRIFHEVVNSDLLGALSKGDVSRAERILDGILPDSVSPGEILDGIL